MSVKLKALIGKLNPETRNALEAAAGLCLSRTHYDVEIEHYLMKLLDRTDGDLGGHPQALRGRPLAPRDRAHPSLDRLKSGNARTPTLSPTLLKMLTEAWLTGSIDFDDDQVRTGFTILALGRERRAGRLMREISKEFGKIQAEALKKDFVAIVAGSAEDSGPAAAAAAATVAGRRDRAGGKTPNLDQYTVDLTERAREGKIDPVLGRDFEIRQVVDILTRRRQNNPILVGEAGVGKTAVVEGFALRIVQGDVPPPLKNVTLRTLDLALLQAGAGREGRVREPAEGPDRRSEDLAHADHPVHRRSAHHDRRGRHGRAGRRRQPAQAGAGARRAAHHRRHHLVGIQEVLREGPGPGAPLPGGEGRGADGGEVSADDARRRRRAREAPQRAHSGRWARGGGAALAPLPRRPPAARQGGERAGHGLRAAGAGAERHAAGHRGRAAPARRSRRAGPRAGAGGRGRRRPRRAARPIAERADRDRGSG